MNHVCFACEAYAVNGPNDVCLWCHLDAPYTMGTPPVTHIGYLIDGNFYCLDCESWFPGEYSKVYVQNIKFYSQVCTCCRNVVFAGSVKTNLLPAPYEASRKVLQ